MKSQLFVILFALFVGSAAHAEDAAFACSGEMDTSNGKIFYKINRNVVFATTEGYISEALAQLPATKDPFAHSLTMYGNSDGSVSVVLEKVIQGWPKVVLKQNFDSKQTKIVIPYKDNDLEMGLRCVRLK